MLKVSGITKKFKTVTALDDVTLTFPDKGLIAVLGESGSGKSTLFHVLTGAVTPDGGEVRYNGEKLNTDGRINAKGIFGVIFQDNNLLEGLSVSDNLSISAPDKTKQREMLSSLGIERYMNSKAGKISGGEGQRVAIARALLDECSVLLADEPTGSLDEKNGEKVMSLLKDISREKLVLVITHNTFFAQKYADGIVKLEKGKVVQSSGLSEGGEEECGVPVKEGKHMSASFIFKFCAAKMKRGMVKHLTSVVILAVALALIVLPLSFMTTNCKSYYLDKISGYTYSALYDDRNVPEFEQKTQGADMSGFGKYYPLISGEISMIIEDDSVAQGEVKLGSKAAEIYNKDRLIPVAEGEEIEFYGEKFTVSGFAEEVSAGELFNFNNAVYLNKADIRSVLRWSGKAVTDKYQYRMFDIEEDNSLANGECKLNFRLYYLLASEFPEYFDLLKNKITWAFERQNGQGLFALVYSKEFKITGVEGNSPDESETSVLYVNSAEKEEIIDSLSYYHGYFFKTADKDVINYWWSERGVDIYNQGYEEYTQAQSFKDSLMPYAGALLAVGAVLAGLYMSAVQSHIALINRREIYILKSLRVGGGSLLAILLLQFAPLLLGANIIACVFGIAARVIVMRYYPYMPFNVAGGVLITLAVAAVIALIAAAVRITRLNKRFDIKMAR